MSGAPAVKRVSYRCLEAFDIRGQDWVVDARKFLDALQDFSIVSHLGPKGDIARSLPRQAGSSGREKVFITKSVVQNP